MQTWSSLIQIISLEEEGDGGIYLVEEDRHSSLHGPNSVGRGSGRRKKNHLPASRFFLEMMVAGPFQGFSLFFHGSRECKTERST